MTLVEVVGGLALLATLLVGALLTQGRYMRQAASADRRLQAVAAADGLLTSWRLDPRSLPRAGAGVLPGDSHFSWRTQVVPNPSVNDLEAEVIRLDILDDRPEAGANRTITSVEFIIEPKLATTPSPKTKPAHGKTPGNGKPVKPAAGKSSPATIKPNPVKPK